MNMNISFFFKTSAAIALIATLSACKSDPSAGGKPPVQDPPHIEKDWPKERAAYSEKTGHIYKALPGDNMDDSTRLTGTSEVSGYAVRENMQTGKIEMVEVSGTVNHGNESYNLSVGGHDVSGTRAKDGDNVVYSYVKAGTPQAAGYTDAVATLTTDGQAAYFGRSAIANRTLVNDMPLTGTATFNGVADGYLTNMTDSSYSGTYTGTATATADFGAGTMNTNIQFNTAPTSAGGTRMTEMNISGSGITGNEFSGGNVSVNQGATFVGSQTGSDVRGVFGGFVESTGGPASAAAAMIIRGSEGTYQGVIRADR
jgi:hypothetical protein